MTKIVFIINPISGTGSKDSVPALIDKYIDKERFEYEIRLTEHAGHASEIATEAKDSGIDIVVAVGGDGTVNEVARALTDSNTALGIIPCGSGNGLARHLMLPINVKGALEIINECEIHNLDYGVIDGHKFFCTCGMGFDAFISKKFADAGKRGPITYLENVLKVGLTYKPETYEITFDNENDTLRYDNDDENKLLPCPESGASGFPACQSKKGAGVGAAYKAFLISCANASQYGNDAYIAPQASMRDGFLDVVIMEPFDILEASQVSFDMFNKTLNKNQKIKTFKTRSLHVHREKPGVIHYDGDPVDAGTDIDIKIIHEGIKVIVNPHADKKKRHPNAAQSALNGLFNDIHNVREDITHPSKQVKAINQFIQNKLK